MNRIGRSRLASRVIFMAVLLCGSAVMSSAAALEKKGLELAMDQFRAGRLSLAYSGFVRLADRDDPEAARIALIMLRHGKAMFGIEWGASQAQIERWRKLSMLPTQALVTEAGD